MKTYILLSSAILFAMALIPASAYADDSNLMCKRSKCDAHGGSNSGKISISGLDINVKSPDRRSDRRNNNRDLSSNERDAETSPETNPDSDRNENVADTDTNNSVDVDNNDTADIDNNNDNNNDNVVDADNGTDNDTDSVADNNDNNSPPQLNSNDIRGFDPFGGLYGPGT